MDESSSEGPSEDKYNVVELPSSVEVKDSSIYEGETGAFCKASIKRDTRFGPYKGEIVKASHRTKAKIDYRYAWEVFEKRSNVLRHIISASDPKTSNWMRNVNSARFYEEQNILSVQEGFSIYYVAMKDIKPGEELLTWFDPKLLRKSKRRQTKERRQVGYTIELVPWSDEKKFVPEIMETKRARKKKVLSDMISFDEDALLVQRSLNSVLKVPKNRDGPSAPQRIDRRFKNPQAIADRRFKNPEASVDRRFKNPEASLDRRFKNHEVLLDRRFKNPEALSNGARASQSSGVPYKRSEDVDRSSHSPAYHNGASRTIASITPPGKSANPNSNSSQSPPYSHKSVTDTDRMKGSLHQRPKKAVDQRLSGSHPVARGRPPIRRSGNVADTTTTTTTTPTTTTTNSSSLKGKRSQTIFKPFDPALLRPIVFRKKDDGYTEVEDHDEIYMTPRAFRNQCDDQCLCLNKSELLSCRIDSQSAAPSCDEGIDEKVKNDLCVQFSLLPDDQCVISRSRIIFRCDICECAYNHAFSLKRHYLKIHINHRYLSRNDITDCQIETFHTGVEIKERPRNISPRDCSNDKFQTESVKIPLLSELARKKLGLDKRIDQGKRIKEGKSNNEDVSAMTFKVSNATVSLHSEKDKIFPSSSSKDSSSCEGIDNAVTAGDEVNKDIKLTSIDEKEHNRITESNTSKHLPSQDIDNKKVDSDLKFEEPEKQTPQVCNEKQATTNAEEEGEIVLSPVQRDGLGLQSKSPVEIKEEIPEENGSSLSESESKHIPECPAADKSQEINAKREEISETCSDKPTDRSEKFDSGFDAKIDERTVSKCLKDGKQKYALPPEKDSVSSNQSKKLKLSSEKESVVSCVSEKSDAEEKSDISPEKECAASCQSEQLCPGIPTDAMGSNVMEAKSKTCDDDKQKEEVISVPEKTCDYKTDPPASGLDEQNPACDNNVDKAEQIILNDTGSSNSETACMFLGRQKSSHVNETSVEGSVPTPSLLSPNSKAVASMLPTKLSTQPQVILLVPIMSTKPVTMNQPVTTSSGSLVKLPMTSCSGLATTSPGPINLISSQSSLPMVVLSQFSSSGALPLVQGFASIAGMPGDCKATPLFIPDPSSGIVVSSQHNISTFSTTPIPSASLLPPSTPFIQSTGRPSTYMSVSYLTGSDHEQQPADLYRCHMCVLLFKTTADLKHHIRNDPHRFKGGLKQYACNHCSLRFRNKHNLSRHNLTHHSNLEDTTDRKFRCLTCGKGFTTENYLRMHARFHLGKSFPCKYGCQDMVFPNAATLVKHLRAVHPGLNLKEYIREKAMKERLMRRHANSAGGMPEASYSMFHPGMGFQAKRGRPKGSRNKNPSNVSVKERPPSNSRDVSFPEESVASRPTSEISEVGKENDGMVQVNRFMFKCKQCPRSFSFHLRLLQHRSRVHGIPQSVQEFLHEMSKAATEGNDLDCNSSVFEFSPPPSPNTFFPNINARGAENMHDYIEGGIECAEKFKKDELVYSITDEDIKPIPKLMWTYYNFPVCFQYRDDPTVFYDTVDGVLPHQLTEASGTDSLEQKGDACESPIVEDKGKSSQHSYDVGEKPISDLSPSVASETNLEGKQKLDEKYVNNEAREKDGKTSDLDWSEVAENAKQKISSELSDHGKRIASSVENGGTSSDLPADKGEKTMELNCLASLGSQSPDIGEKESPPALYDSGYSSLSSWGSVSDGAENQDPGNQMLLNTMLLELKRHSMSSMCKESNKNDQTVCGSSERKTSVRELPESKGRDSGYDSSETSTVLRALNLCTNNDKKVKLRDLCRTDSMMKVGFDFQLLEALDLTSEDLNCVVNKLNRSDFVNESRKRCNLSDIFSSPSGQYQSSRSLEHHQLDSVLNMSDSSKHDHRRYSIWSRQQNQKAHAKNADVELIHCPVVECVRKSQTMKERRLWEAKMKAGQGAKQSAHQRKREAFAEGLGLMPKREYEQSYHVKQKENYCIKPPEIWKTYDKIWFGKKGTITVVCSICHRHFSCLELCLRHQRKKHPHIEPLSLAMEKGNFVEDMYYYYPMAYGILAHTQLIQDNMPPPEVYVCTRCSFPFKNVGKLHSHLTVCDPSQGDTSSRGQPRRKKKLLPMMDRRSQNSTPDSNTGAKKLPWPGMQSMSSKSQGREIVLKKGYVLSTIGTVKPSLEKRANTTTKFPASRQSNLGIVNAFLPGRHRRKNFGLLYNPSNHARRRELYQVLDQHQCHGCNLKFKSMSLLERHVKKCSGKDKLRSQKPLLSALADDAAVRKQHTCRYCNKRFTYIKGVDLHYKRICSVRKVKEEENKLTDEDFAHEAELQRIIEHMKWSKSLNKDSSDIILGHVRVEEDGTLIRVNKKRGRPHGKTKRIKKKGFKWTTLKRRRPGANGDDDDEEEEDSGEDNSKDSNQSATLNMHAKKAKLAVEASSNPEETRKRKMSASDAELQPPPPPPKKKGRPRKTAVAVKPVETTGVPRKRGRPPLKKREPSPKQESESKVEQSHQQNNSSSKAQVKADHATLQAAVEARRKESARSGRRKQDSVSSSLVKPPTRKRGRPKKFDPSEMESSYKKKKKGDADYVTISSAKKSGKETLANLAKGHKALKTELLKGRETKDEEKDIPSDEKSSTSSEERKLDSCTTSGKVKKDIVIDKKSKSISIFETTNAIESSSVKDASSIEKNQAKSTFIKNSKKQNKASPEQKQAEEIETNNAKTEGKPPQNSKAKEELFKSASLEKKSVSGELLKYLTCDNPDMTSSSLPLAKSDSNVGTASKTVSKSDNKLVKDNICNAGKSPIKAAKVISPQAKRIKIVAVAPSTLMMKSPHSSTGDSPLKLDVEKEAKNLQASATEPKETSSEDDSVVGTSVSPNSSIVVVSRSPASAVTLSSPPGKNQVISPPLSLRVISVPAGATQSNIKFVKSSTSSPSKHTGPEIVNVVSSSFISSPGNKTMAQTAVPLSSPLKPVTVIHNSGLLRNVSPSSGIPLVPGANIQLPRIIKGNISRSAVRLPQVISGSIRLPHTQLGSAVIVQPATVFQQGKTKVAMVPSTNVCSPPSRFTCSSVPLKVSNIPPGAKIVKVGNISGPVEVKQEGSGWLTSPTKTNPVASHGTPSAQPKQMPK